MLLRLVDLRRKTSDESSSTRVSGTRSEIFWLFHYGNLHLRQQCRANEWATRRDFVAVLPESVLKENKPTRAVHNEVPILLVRRGERVFALAETCSHFSGPLSEGKLEGDNIVCPLHNSTSL